MGRVGGDESTELREGGGGSGSAPPQEASP